MKCFISPTASLATFAFSNSPCSFRWKTETESHLASQARLTHITRTRFSSAFSSSKTQLDIARVPSYTTIGYGPEATVSMALLALQFGIQPVLVRRFTPKSINKSTVVFVQDVLKFFLAGAALVLTGGWNNAVQGWNFKSCLLVAGIPSLLYTAQNLATLVAYQNLSPLTFNVLNQTKTLSAALSCYLLMGKVQSKMQILSLVLLFCSACIIEKMIPVHRLLVWRNSQRDDSLVPNPPRKASGNTNQNLQDNHTKGIIGVLLASLTSGLAGAYTQKFLQEGVGGVGIGRNAYLLTMEICIISMFVMATSMLKSKDGDDVRDNGFFHNWTPMTVIPATTNAMGGILVGLVTKYAGSVKKGFALIFGLLISGMLQTFTEEDKSLSFEQVLGGILAGFSLWMYAAYPA